MTTALRLLERVLQAYPHAFSVAAGRCPLCAGGFSQLSNSTWQAGFVLKQEHRDLYQDVLGMLPLVASQKGQHRSRDCLWWDVSDTTSWSQVRVPVRVVRSEETYQVRRQSDKQLSQKNSAWMCVTTLPAARASTALVVHLGHARWDIENYGFNELVNGWHADHIYKHDPRAIEAFTLDAVSYTSSPDCGIAAAKHAVRAILADSVYNVAGFGSAGPASTILSFASESIFA